MRFARLASQWDRTTGAAVTELDAMGVDGTTGHPPAYIARFGRALPYFLMAVSIALAAVETVNSHWSWRPFEISVALSVASMVWHLLAELGVLGSQDAQRNHILVFVVRWVLSAGLVLCDPWYGVFAWYLWVGVVQMRGRRAWSTALVATAFVVGYAETGAHGLPTHWQTVKVFAYCLAVLCTIVLAGCVSFAARRNDELSSRRRDAIVELVETNERLEAALRENAGLHAQLVEQAREAGIADERERMAREIHDTLAQGLTGIVTQLQAAEQASEQPTQWRRHLELAQRLARESLTEARRSVHALRPGALSGTQLPEALAEVAREWSAMNGPRADVTISGPPVVLRPEIEVALLRTAQEALANVAKHARATRVGITLSYMEDVITLDVRDDGVGFDPGALPPSGPSGGFGLGAMRQRVDALHGAFEVESDDSGTAIFASVPLFAPATDEPVTVDVTPEDRAPLELPDQATKPAATAPRSDVRAEPGVVRVARQSLFAPVVRHGR